MSVWEPTAKDRKQYPHFDAPLSISELRRIANDRNEVEKHRFFPFLRYIDSHRPFRPYEEDPKKREIRYAARADAAIFSRYRQQLSELYEAELHRLGLSECVLAYRRIPVSPCTKAGKSNIDHAKDAFDRIGRSANCCAVTLDISKYFEHVDHDRIKEIWSRLLGVPLLPKDHFQVFKAITDYRVVDSRDAYRALGYFGTKSHGIEGYLVTKKDVEKQLCSLKDFNEIICGKGAGRKSLIQKNPHDYGIPQGAPLSDLLANAYLIDFDVEMKAYADSLGGYYMRYSDDILFIAPVTPVEADDIMQHVADRIQAYGRHLQIKAEKCTIDHFYKDTGALRHAPIFPVGQARNGLNYLGFRFDGQRVYLRETTLANFRRKMARTVNAETYHLVSRFPGKDLTFLQSQLNTQEIIKRFGRVSGFDSDTEKNSWTFWTYVQRATKTFGKRARIIKQVQGYKQVIRDTAQAALRKHYLHSLK